MMNVPLLQGAGGQAGSRDLSRGTTSGIGMPGERLDGWKRIAAHFGRERSTAIRWARERGLPVHRMPGGKTATVYALRGELDRWAGLPEVGAEPGAARRDEAAPGSAPPLLPAPAAAFSPRRFDIRGGVLLAGAMIAAAALLMTAASSAYSITGPASAAAATQEVSDPMIGGRLMAARDLVADRETDGLERAIGLLEGVTQQAPRFAPGHVGLAEALVLSREFGRRGDAEAFERARGAAHTAVRLDPEMASGHRMLGFIAYWADGDFAQAQQGFRRALELAPQDVLTHFWYGNVLSDHGDHAAALAELERALALQPGSVAIRTDLAWARWAMGEDARAEAELAQIVQRHPGFAVARDCLAIIALADGRDADYVYHFKAFARARGDARLLRRAADLARAQGEGPGALRRAVLDQALAEVAAGRSSRVWPVLVASVQGDRARVAELLRAADKAHEAWGDAALVARIRALWQGDPAIAALIDRRMASFDERRADLST